MPQFIDYSDAAESFHALFNRRKMTDRVKNLQAKALTLRELFE
jgi:hypothetical protein